MPRVGIQRSFLNVRLKSLPRTKLYHLRISTRYISRIYCSRCCRILAKYSDTAYLVRTALLVHVSIFIVIVSEYPDISIIHPISTLIIDFADFSIIGSDTIKFAYVLAH